MKIMIQRHTSPGLPQREIQNLGILGALKPNVQNVQDIPPLRSKQHGCQRRQSLIEDDSLHATW